MVVKLHDIREIITGSLNESQWDELIGVDFEDVNSKEFYVTYSEIQDIENNPICKSKYKITIELCDK